MSPSVLSHFRSLHVDSSPNIPSLTTSYVHGTTSASLLSLTVGQSLDTAAERWPDREAVVFLQDGIRKTFSQFQQDVRLNLCVPIFAFASIPACINFQLLVIPKISQLFKKKLLWFYFKELMDVFIVVG